MEEKKKKKTQNMREEDRQRILERRRRERARQRKRKAMMMRAAVAGGLVLILILAITAVALGVRKGKQDKAQEKARQEQALKEEEEKQKQLEDQLAQADRLAAGYDYDGAIKLLQDLEEKGEDVQAKIDECEAAKSTLVAADVETIPHVFFHILVADPSITWNLSGEDEYKIADYNQVMTTIDEFKGILQQMYDRGYVLVRLHDLVEETKNEEGETVFTEGKIMLPEGKKPLIFSYDDTNYYEYMLENGFTYKLILGEDGKIWSWGLDPEGNEVVSRDLDAITILDKFVEEHPDFSPFGAKACLSLTGYEGILGYRTQTDGDVEWTEEREAFRQSEREAVKPIIEELRRTGWTFGSHTWGHIRLGGSRSMAEIQTDTQKWFDEVGSLVGETNVLFYPHGERPDGDDWQKTGEVFQYLQSQGFRIFCSVGIESFSYIKKDISAVICDRLHPDGTTLRSKYVDERYGQFYDVREIIDLDVRPDLGVGWS